MSIKINPDLKQDLIDAITLGNAASNPGGGSIDYSTVLASIKNNTDTLVGNTDTIEVLQTNTTAAVNATASLIDQVETLLGSLQTNTQNLQSLLSAIGLNTDGVEILLGNVVSNTNSTITSVNTSNTKLDSVKTSVDLVKTNIDSSNAKLDAINALLTTIKNAQTSYNNNAVVDLSSGSTTFSACHSLALVAIPNISGVVDVTITVGASTISMYPGETLTMDASTVLANDVTVLVTTGKVRATSIK